jgi:hypothetical protein
VYNVRALYPEKDYLFPYDFEGLVKKLDDAITH